jgi:type III secretory pathway component EscV
MGFPVFVMAVLATAIHVLLFLSNKKKHVDHRDKPGDDEGGNGADAYPCFFVMAVLAPRLSG